MPAPEVKTCQICSGSTLSAKEELHRLTVGAAGDVIRARDRLEAAILRRDSGAQALRRVCLDQLADKISRREGLSVQELRETIQIAEAQNIENIELCEKFGDLSSYCLRRAGKGALMYVKKVGMHAQKILDRAEGIGDETSTA